MFWLHFNNQLNEKSSDPNSGTLHSNMGINRSTNVYPQAKVVKVKITKPQVSRCFKTFSNLRFKLGL